MRIDEQVALFATQRPPSSTAGIFFDGPSSPLPCVPSGLTRRLSRFLSFRRRRCRCRGRCRLWPRRVG
eukprot:8590244-Pyramimonas_sp.AAC.1